MAASIVNDSASAAAGVRLVRMGTGSSSAPALQLSGTTWTPNRSGRTILATDWPQLPLGQFVNVAGSVLNGVFETPPLANYNNSASNADGPINFWNGAAWDYAAQAMYLTWGGGHQATAENDNAVYKLDAATMDWSRPLNRSADADRRTWSTASHSLVNALGPDPQNVPQADGRAGAVHTYDLPLWLPPGTAGAGSTKGGLYTGGWCRSVVNLDTNTVAAPHWWNPERSGYPDWSYGAAVLDGNAVYHPGSNGYRVDRFNLAATEATDASATSFGALTVGAATTPFFMYHSRAFGWLRQRREYVAIHATAQATRVRYGQAVDAGATTWTAYTDAITLTSSDGSHADFTTAAFNAGTVPPGPLYGAGLDYDHAAGCLWLMSSAIGGYCYRITGLSGSTWNVEKLPASAAPSTSVNGTFGRWRVADLGGVRVGIRVASTSAPTQVIRLTGPA